MDGAALDSIRTMDGHVGTCGDDEILHVVQSLRLGSFRRVQLDSQVSSRDMVGSSSGA